jgi:hypothetical protein
MSTKPKSNGYSDKPLTDWARFEFLYPGNITVEITSPIEGRMPDGERGPIIVSDAMGVTHSLNAGWIRLRKYPQPKTPVLNHTPKELRQLADVLDRLPKAKKRK